MRYAWVLAEAGFRDSGGGRDFRHLPREAEVAPAAFRTPGSPLTPTR